MNIVIFRVQDKDGRGPWKPGFSAQWVEDRTLQEYTRLIPWVAQFGKGILDQAAPGMHFGCGCRTLAQLREWFKPTEYSKLHQLGYCAVRMEVGRILAESNIQCVFERAKPLCEDSEPVMLYSHNITAHDKL